MADEPPPNGESRPGTGAAATTEPAEQLSPKYPGIVRPSVNYERNKNTFAYRLSEGVFGSLLASYILGFVGLVAVYLQPANTFRLVPNNKDAIISDIFSSGHVDLQKLAALFTIQTIDRGSGTATWARTGFEDIIIVAQYLIISLLFAIFTALIYFNYHQSILYLSSDQKKSPVDFLLSVCIGVFFGLSMLFPLSTMFWLGCLTIFALWRKRRLLLPYWRHLASASGPSSNGTDPNEATDRNEEEKKVMARVRGALLKSTDNYVLRSWGTSASPSMWATASLLTIGPIITLAITKLGINAGYFEPENANFWIVIANLAVCSGTACFLFRRLNVATRNMPARQADGDKKLNDALVVVLTRLSEQKQ